MTPMFQLLFQISFCASLTYASTPNNRLLPVSNKFKISHDDVGRNAEIQIPIRYHHRIDHWIKQFSGQKHVRRWLERANRYLPYVRDQLKISGLPQDLAYLVLIESGVSPFAKSPAHAVGPWQFIHETGKRFGLEKKWWLDERKDFEKSTRAAIRYFRELYRMFGDWYLAMAAYNMGENGLRRRIRTYQTRDFWQLADRKLIPKETQDYVPKFLAIVFIAKSPSLYGFDLHRAEPLVWERVSVPGGTELYAIADRLGITRKQIRVLNAELVRGYVPRGIPNHFIRVPKGGRAILARQRLFEGNRKFALTR